MQKLKKRIEDIFLKLLLKKDFHEIEITEIQKKTLITDFQWIFISFVFHWCLMEIFETFFLWKKNYSKSIDNKKTQNLKVQVSEQLSPDMRIRSTPDHILEHPSSLFEANFELLVLHAQTEMWAQIWTQCEGAKMLSLGGTLYATGTILNTITAVPNRWRRLGWD